MDKDKQKISGTGLFLEQNEWEVLTDDLYVKMNKVCSSKQVKRKIRFISGGEEENDCDEIVVRLKKAKMFMPVILEDDKIYKILSPQFSAERGIQTADKEIELIKMVRDAYSKGKELTFKMYVVRKPFPDDIILMKVCYLILLEKEIKQSREDDCVACQIDSPAQSDHCQSGNCLDISDMSTIAHYKIGKVKITDCQLSQFFSFVRLQMGGPPKFTDQLAKAARAFLHDGYLIQQIQNWLDAGIPYTGEERRALVDFIRCKQCDF